MAALGDAEKTDTAAPLHEVNAGRQGAIKRRAAFNAKDDAVADVNTAIFSRPSIRMATRSRIVGDDSP